MWTDAQQADLREAMLLVEELCDRYGAELTEEELEALADLLLRLCGPDEDYPCGKEIEPGQCPRLVVMHSLDDLTTERVRAVRRQPTPPPADAPGVVQVLVARLLVAAGLTSRRRQVARLRLWGYKPAQVADLLGLSRKAVYTEWAYAREALRAALGRGRLDEMPAPGVDESTIRAVDLREVVRLEQRRCIYAHPTHCAVGKEKCRTTGVCKYRGPRFEP